ncbi:MAG: hypothetical protein LBQ58_06305 [Synergistaceae bacterium]|nr:hypothetical protein [Synergistaceae bacterium]
MFDLSIIFLRKRYLIACLILIFGCGALLYSLLAAKIYKAECRILPSSSENVNITAAIMSQMGGLASLAGISGGATKGELLMGVLRGQTVVDKIIDQFDLMTVYEQDYRVKMRELATSDILHATEDVKSGIVTVAVLDEDPERAAAMANAFVDELKNVMQSLAIGEAAQRRIFFEAQTLQAHKALGEVEDELQKYQEQSGVVAAEPQLQALVASITELRAQVAAKEVEISSLRTYARGDNPSLKRAMSELASLRSELKKLEQQEQKSSNEPSGQMASLREVPQLGLEYQRRLRDVQFAATMYELMLKQFEAAKIDESREAIYVQVIDPATPPDYKFKPKRALIVVFSVLLGLCLGMLWALCAYYIENVKNDPDENKTLEEIKSVFSFRK